MVQWLHTSRISCCSRCAPLLRSVCSSIQDHKSVPPTTPKKPPHECFAALSRPTNITAPDPVYRTPLPPSTTPTSFYRSLPHLTTACVLLLAQQHMQLHTEHPMYTPPPTHTHIFVPLMPPLTVVQPVPCLAAAADVTHTVILSSCGM